MAQETNNTFQLSLSINPPHNNQYLFSDHYLDNLLPQDRRWQNALSEAQAFLEWLQDHYARERNQLASYKDNLRLINFLLFATITACLPWLVACTPANLPDGGYPNTVIPQNSLKSSDAKRETPHRFAELPSGTTSSLSVGTPVVVMPVESEPDLLDGTKNELEAAFFSAMQTFESYTITEDELRIRYTEGTLLFSRLSD